MVITFSATRAGNGPRPINPTTDFPQLVGLLKLVFASEMEADSRRMFEQATVAAQPAVLWRLDPVLARLTPGFVWEENGRIVGNITLLVTKRPQRFLVANVAVHPDFRRRGIARMLMEVVTDDVRRRRGQEILLQVERDNDPAINLYRSLGYVKLGSMTSWRLGDSRAQDFVRRDRPSGAEAPVKELPSSRWREAFELDQLALTPDLHWPEPLAADAYQRGLVRRLTDFASGRKAETWMTVDDSHTLTGIADIRSEWGRAHQLSIRVHPQWRGQLERPLLRKLVVRVQHLPRRRVLFVHDADDSVVNLLAREAHFTPQRTLTHMRLSLG